MNQLLSARRQRHRREQQRLPFGFISAVLTACVVTLIGVFSGVEPFVVLVRAFVSATLLCALVSMGVGIIRTANVKNEK